MSRFIFRFFMSLAVTLYRLTAGRIGGTMAGLPVLLLTTTGRKTGKQRTTPLGYFDHDGGYVIIGSNAGFDTHPAWFHNLRASPRAVIQIADKRFEVKAEIAEPDLRARLWGKLMELSPSYGYYAQRTTREIPLVVLRPARS